MNNPRLIPCVKVSPVKFFILCTSLDMPFYFTIILPVFSSIAYRLWKIRKQQFDHSFFLAYAAVKISISILAFFFFLIQMRFGYSELSSHDSSTVVFFVISLLLTLFSVYNTYIGVELLFYLLRAESNKSYKLFEAGRGGREEAKLRPAPKISFIEEKAQDVVDPKNELNITKENIEN